MKRKRSRKNRSQPITDSSEILATEVAEPSSGQSSSGQSTASGEAVSGPGQLAKGLHSWLAQWSEGWNQFWFTPREPRVLGLIRFLVGLIVFWTLLVWTFELSTFLGPDGLLPVEYRTRIGATYAWSHLDWCTSDSALLLTHGLGLLVVAMFTVGLWTRWTAALTALIVISYGNRSIGAGFGLDQINAFLCLYCAMGNAGGGWSVEHWWNQRRNSNSTAGIGSLVSTTRKCDPLTNIAIRLIQIHLCLVYFFAAIGKLQGETWWTGEAVWLSLASYEYQTIDMTWLAGYLPLVSLMTLVALFWELFYPVLIWPRLTRPLMLAIAVPVHLGIGLCMGMLSFGLVMLVANLAFWEANSD